MFKRRGAFIVFEGIDGSGKTTQSKILYEKLRDNGYNVHLTQEATHSDIGSLLRKGLTGERPMDTRVIAAMYVADRLDHLLNNEDGIIQKIKDGVTVISDRYYLSSLAYNTIDTSMTWVLNANKLAIDLLKPDITFFMDVDVDTAMSRISKNRTHQEVFENEERLRRVRKNYYAGIQTLEIWRNEIIKELDGTQATDVLADHIYSLAKTTIDSISPSKFHGYTLT